MSSKIYVGGLPYATTDAQLQDLFSTHGAVESARVITDKFTGRSRGFGFVEMANSDEAQKAIQALNGTDFEGRNLTVNEARPQERRPGGGGGGFGDRGGERRGGGGGWRWRRWPQSLVVFSDHFPITKRGARSERPFCYF